MSLSTVLKQSHMALHEIGQQLVQSEDSHTQMTLFNKLWQQFFAHEQAEEHVATLIMRGKQLANTDVSEKALKHAIDEHHYFEQFVENIAMVAVDDPRRKQLIHELVAQLNSHMQYEEAFIFPRFDEMLDENQQQQLINDYLDKIKQVKAIAM